VKTHLTNFLAIAGLGLAFLPPQVTHAQTPTQPEPVPPKPEAAPARSISNVAVAEPAKLSEEQYLQARLRAFDSQRPAAAQAVFRLGECYRRLKRFEEARIQYARILREFTDSPELVAQSARLLVELGKNVDPTAGASAAPATRLPVLGDLPVLGNLFTTPPLPTPEKPDTIGTIAAPAPASAPPKPASKAPEGAPSPADTKEAAPAPSNIDPTQATPGSK
jgi:hypothetical protein